MEFLDRQALHDVEAHLLLEEQISRLGALIFPYGVEYVGPELAQVLRDQPDPLARLIRYRPDRIVIIRGVATFYAEIKCEAAGQQNFGIEVDADEALREIHASQQPVAYVLCDLQSRTISCCWAPDLPRDHIDVPPRGDVQCIAATLAEHYPGARVRRLKRRPQTGSGTPYFLVGKQAQVLTPLEQFIRNLER